MKKMKIALASFLLAGVYYTSFGTSNAPVPPKGECICLDIYQPVCIIATGQQFSNACYASCSGFTPDQWEDCNVSE